MSDPIPKTYRGRIALARSIAAGDEIAGANNETQIDNPTGPELLQKANDQETRLLQRNAQWAQLKTRTDDIQSFDAELIGDLRGKSQFIKAVYRTEPAKLKRYGLSAETTPGQPPSSPLGLKVVAEQPNVVTLEIEGGKGADRFEIQKRLEGTTPDQAIRVVTDVRPSSRRWQDFTIQSGSRYIYFATAHNAAGSVGPSNEVLVTP